MIRWLTALMGRARSHRSLAEDRIPVDARGQPDLAGYKESAAYYAALHREGLASLADPGLRRGPDAASAFRKRVHGTWGLTARGAESLPFLLPMLTDARVDAREDAAAILSALGRHSGTVDLLVRALEAETGTTARDAQVIALGALKNRAAIPALAALLRDPLVDADTRSLVVQSLGRIARRRFDDRPQPEQAALDWVERQDPASD